MRNEVPEPTPKERRICNNCRCSFSIDAASNNQICPDCREDRRDYRTRFRITHPAAKLLFASYVSLAIGVVLFVLGLGMAFTPGHSGGDGLVMLSVLLAGLAAIGNAITFVWGLASFLCDYRVRGWWLLSIVGVIGTAWGISFLLNL